MWLSRFHHGAYPCMPVGEVADNQTEKSEDVRPKAFEIVPSEDFLRAFRALCVH